MLPLDDIQIRPACPEDHPAICDMVAALAAYHGDEAALNARTLAQLTQGPHPWISCMLATVSNCPAGYAALQTRVQLHFARKVMDLEHLYVIPERRGQGIGAALIDAVRAEARRTGCHKLTVGTAPGNDRAAALYLKAGFEVRPPEGTRFAMTL